MPKLFCNSRGVLNRMVLISVVVYFEVPVLLNHIWRDMNAHVCGLRNMGYIFLKLGIVGTEMSFNFCCCFEERMEICLLLVLCCSFKYSKGTLWN